MVHSVTTTQIDNLWETINRIHEFSVNTPIDQLIIFSQLFSLINETTSPQDYCRVLRKRAQFFSLAGRFDNALTDLRLEWGIARKHNLEHLIDDIERHIARLSVWRKLEL